MIEFNDIKTVYFSGIGGIGMSALARYFKLQGKSVYGYDLHRTPLTEQLEREGISIHYEDNPGLIPSGINLAVYTPAVPADNLEMQALRSMRIPVMKRAEVLGMISRSMFTVAVAGTHGKTTVTSMIAHILHHAGVNIAGFIGGIAKNFGSNFIFDEKAEIMVTEADEYDRSLLQLEPDIAVISSLSEDHLDIYKDIEDLRDTFGRFLSKVAPGGLIVTHKDVSVSVPEGVKRVIYGIDPKCQVFAENVTVKEGKFYFEMHLPGAQPQELSMNVPGKHSVENALAAAAIAKHLGLSAGQIKEGLETFQGVERRFDFRVVKKNKVYIDDYAHHPDEINATLSAAKALYPGKKMTVVFQPHLYSRTRDFADGFAEALQKADTVILLPVYPAREKPEAGADSDLIFGKINNDDKYLLQKEELTKFLKDLNPGLLLTLGAGDIGLMTGQIERLMNE